MEYIELDMNDDEFEAFIKELATLQAATIDKAIKLADKHKIDRATMLDGVGKWLCYVC